ncbi:MAG: aminopeptidase [Deltaproteobacteria bacterium]|nr:MAG: aminopeptidase [Deltaproteobacteria bacterium]
MFTNRQMQKYCDVLLWALKTARKENFKKNDVVLIRYDLAAIRMAEILQAKLLNMGMNPIPRMGLTPNMERNFFEKANNRQLVFQTPGEMELCKNLNGSIYLYAPESLTHLSLIDPKRIGKAVVARKPLRDILDKKDELGKFGWALCMVPTPELAKHAELSLKEYTAQVIKACYLGKKNPVKEWKAIHKKAMAIKKWMNSMEVKHYHIQSDNVDLRVTPGKKRKWIGISGHNIPSFEIFLSPDWRGTEGIYFANQPSFRNGNYVEGVRIEFRKGNAAKVEAKKGEDFVVKQLSMDGGARRVGEFSLTDKRFSKIDKFMANTLYDENYGGRYGNCHLALGSSYSDTYDGDPSRLTKDKKKKLGFNDSALHWDLVNTEEKKVTAHLSSGERIIVYEDGIFKC